MNMFFEEIKNETTQDGSFNTEAEKKDFVQKVRAFLANNRDKRFAGAIVKRVEFFLELVMDYWSGQYRDISAWSVGLIIAGIVYLFTPADLIPDVIIGIGWVDDATVITAVVAQLKEELDKYAKWKGVNVPDNDSEQNAA